MFNAPLRVSKMYKHDENGYPEFLDVKIEIRPHDMSSELWSVVRDAILSAPTRVSELLASEPAARLCLSITGTAGEIATPRYARAEALRRMTDDLTDDGMLADFNQRNNTNYRSPERAARYALSFDGEYSGLDVHKEITERVRGKRVDRVYVGHSWGCLHDEIRKYAHDLAPLIAFHLNDMKPGAPDQEAALAVRRETMSQEQCWKDTYDARCAYLDSLGILDSKHEGDIFTIGDGKRPALGYRYGSRHVVTEIAHEAFALVASLVNADSEEV